LRSLVETLLDTHLYDMSREMTRARYRVERLLSDRETSFLSEQLDQLRLQKGMLMCHEYRDRVARYLFLELPRELRRKGLEDSHYTYDNRLDELKSQLSSFPYQLYDKFLCDPVDFLREVYYHHVPRKYLFQLLSGIILMILKGQVQIRWNWNASTTPGKCRKFFGDAMLDGTLSRMSFSTIYTDDDRMPLYGIYDEKFQEQVQQAVAQLNDAKGLVGCRKANALAAAMIEENRQYSALADDDVYRELSYRATLSAFKRGMVLYLLNGQKWCKEIEDFVRWSYHYDMWCKMWIFGEKMRRAMDLDKAVMLPGRRNLMEFLQDTFTLDDLNTVRRAQGMKDDGSAQLRKWLSRGYCTFNPATQQYTKSPQFLEKHQKAA
jgi:hypothetical protein